jgi:teichuronic acid biosynthesis glycosyltransferase TuaG
LKKHNESFQVTVFTDPLLPPIKREPGLSNLIRYIAKLIKEQIPGYKRIASVSYGGHFGVTRSLCFGLAQLADEGVTFNYNPTRERDIFSNVIVLDGIGVLNDCIRYKASKNIKTLFAGPNLMVRSNEFNNVLANMHIDRVVVPSKWVKRAYIEDQPSLDGRIVIWPAGVNHTDFNPEVIAKMNHTILLYQKNAPETLLDSVRKTILDQGFEVIDLKYGNHSQQEYKQILNRVHAAVVMSKSESQGIGLLEAWSMNVPTFIWENTFELIIKGKLFLEHSSAPYLTDSTGIFFSDIDELIVGLKSLKKNEINFNPRSWVLNNMTDKIAARNLVNAFKEAVNDANKVSVIISNYNRKELLMRAIESVKKQTHIVLEILVCDDGSTDGSYEAVVALSDAKIKWIDCGKNGRPAIPRNIGLKQAEGDWVAFLDNDDWWEANKLESQLTAAKKMGVNAVCTNARRIYVNNEIEHQGPFYSYESSPVTFNDLIKENRIICSSVLVKRDLILEAGGFPEAPCYAAIEDYATWLKIAALTDWFYINEPLMNYLDNPFFSIRKKGLSFAAQQQFVFTEFLNWGKATKEYSNLIKKQMRLIWWQNSKIRETWILIQVNAGQIYCWLAKKLK